MLLNISTKMILQEKKAKAARNLEVGQSVGDRENLVKKATGHIRISFAKMANLLEYCTLQEFVDS
jgi:hypothetical protein